MAQMVQDGQYCTEEVDNLTLQVEAAEGAMQALRAALVKAEAEAAALRDAMDLQEHQNAYLQSALEQTQKKLKEVRWWKNAGFVGFVIMGIAAFAF